MITMKAYVKPDILFEDFDLSISVATCQIVLDKDGNVKSVNDKGYQSTIQEYGLFSSACDYFWSPETDIGYFGGGVNPTSGS